MIIPYLKGFYLLIYAVRYAHLYLPIFVPDLVKHTKRQRELLLLAHDMNANFLIQNGASKSDFRMR